MCKTQKKSFVGFAPTTSKLKARRSTKWAKNFSIKKILLYASYGAIHENRTRIICLASKSVTFTPVPQVFIMVKFTELWAYFSAVLFCSHCFDMKCRAHPYHSSSRLHHCRELNHCDFLRQSRIITIPSTIPSQIILGFFKDISLSWWRRKGSNLRSLDNGSNELPTTLLRNIY